MEPPRATDSEPDNTWVSLTYQEIEDRLAKAPINEIVGFCRNSPHRCQEALRARRIREFGKDESPEIYRNPIDNYRAAKVRYYLNRATLEMDAIPEEYRHLTDRIYRNDAAKLKELFDRKARKQLLTRIEAGRKYLDLEKDDKEQGNTVQALSYALSRPSVESAKAEATAQHLLAYLQANAKRPKVHQIYSPSLKLDWFPVGSDLKNFQISESQGIELQHRLTALDVKVDDWVKFFDMQGGHPVYFMSEMPYGNFRNTPTYPSSFMLFLERMGLTPNVYEQWR